jgi:hypothetical protein
MERLDIHVALEVCEIVIKSATLVAIVFALSGLPIYVAQFPLAPFNEWQLRKLLSHFSPSCRYHSVAGPARPMTSTSPG